MFNFKELTELLNETKKLRDQFKQQLEGFKNTSPQDLADSETIFDAKAEGKPLDLGKIHEDIKSGYEDTIESFNKAIQDFEKMLSSSKT